MLSASRQCISPSCREYHCCVCALYVCVGCHSVVCIELNAELEGTSNLPLCCKEENQYSSENNSQFSAKEGLGHPPLSSLDQLNLRRIRLKFDALSVFLFLAKQRNLDFSHMEHFFLCYGILSCCIFYAIPFLMTPGGRRVLSSILLIALLCGGGEGCQLWVCLFSLPGCLTQFSCSPLGL